MSAKIKNINELMDQVIRLRTIVLALGESADPSWWPTNFMNETGFRFLARIYPRSYFQAALNSAGKAARDAHDLSTGKIGVYHLFRLPVILEADIHSYLISSGGDLSADFRELFTDTRTLMERLKLLGEVKHVQEPVAGALQIGDTTDWRKIGSYKKAASIYYNAFLNGKQVYPYLSSNGSKEYD